MRKKELAERIAKRLCKHPPTRGSCLCSMRAGETCSVCVPSTLDEEKTTALILAELDAILTEFESEHQARDD